MFLENFSHGMLLSAISLLLKCKSEFVGNAALNFSIKYIQYAVKIPFTMEVLKPYVENILFETVVPIMLLAEKDLEQFENEPSEFIRKQLDWNESLFIAKNSCADLILTLTGFKTKPS